MIALPEPRRGRCACQTALQHWARGDLLLAEATATLAAADDPRLQEAARQTAAAWEVTGQIIDDVVDACHAHRSAWPAAALAILGTAFALAPVQFSVSVPVAVVLFALAGACSVWAVRAVPWAVRAVRSARRLKTPAASAGRRSDPATLAEVLRAAEESLRLALEALPGASCAAPLAAGLRAAHGHTLPRLFASVTAAPLLGKAA